MNTMNTMNTINTIKLSQQEWEDEFKPIPNHLDNNASFQDENGIGIMFETYGEELDFVKSRNPLNIWTLMDCDEHEDGCVISQGFHFVNRIGYFITEKPFKNNIEYVIE
jgi:hypothetical protein